MTKETEGEAERRSLDRLNRQDATKILEATNLLKVWLEGDERLSIKEAQLFVRAIAGSAEDIQSRIDFKP